MNRLLNWKIFMTLVSGMPHISYPSIPASNMPNALWKLCTKIHTFLLKNWVLITLTSAACIATRLPRLLAKKNILKKNEKKSTSPIPPSALVNKNLLLKKKSPKQFTPLPIPEHLSPPSSPPPSSSPPPLSSSFTSTSITFTKAQKRSSSPGPIVCIGLVAGAPQLESQESIVSQCFPLATLSKQFIEEAIQQTESTMLVKIEEIKNQFSCFPIQHEKNKWSLLIIDWEKEQAEQYIPPLNQIFADEETCFPFSKDELKLICHTIIQQNLSLLNDKGYCIDFIQENRSINTMESNTKKIPLQTRMTRVSSREHVEEFARSIMNSKPPPVESIA
jgi:hypothetical protein